MSVRIYGVSLHCYDDKARHDKFYRVYWWQNPNNGQFYLTKCWGRDGATGQSKTEHCTDQAVAEREMRTVVAAQMQPKKGYQFLGEGSVAVDLLTVLKDPRRTGRKLHDWVGRPPVKLPGNYRFIIREEEDILDLIDA